MCQAGTCGTALILFRKPENGAGFAIEPYNFFNTPQKLERICKICMMLYNISAKNCYNDQKQARDMCENKIIEKPDAIKEKWNQHPLVVTWNQHPLVVKYEYASYNYVFIYRNMHINVFRYAFFVCIFKAS